MPIIKGNKYSGMKTEELLKEHARVSSEVDKLRQERKLIMAELSTRDVEERIAKMAKGLTDKQKARLAQTLSPSGISTTEGVGTPSAG